jgi:LmbE family N-acetylglucosaminyl deacetylase
MSRTLVTFHAHPDDEAFLTAGVMAGAAARGDRVVLVVATQGEVGEVSGVFLAPGEDLGQRRSIETERSAAALGVHRVVFLGFRDSGSDPATARTDGFAAADVDEAARRLAAILREEQADVLTTYDPTGGYGHPDHLQVHHVGYRAAALAGTPTVLEATFNRDLLLFAVDLLPSLDLELPGGFVPPDVSSWFASADEITHEIDVSAHLVQKKASMQAHASQTTGATDSVRNLQLFLALPDDWFAVAFGTEWFIDRKVDPGSKRHDLFETL